MSAWDGPPAAQGATGPQGPPGATGATGPAGADGAPGVGGNPTGAVCFFAGAVAPTGYLLCNGALISRTTYAALFTAIGTTWGAGDGSTTFAIPDLRSRVPVGAGQGAGLTNRALGGYAGAEAHALAVGEMPAHTHVYYRPIQTDTVMNSSSAYYAGNITGDNTQSAGSGTAHNNMQPFTVLNAIIKT